MYRYLLPPFCQLDRHAITDHRTRRTAPERYVLRLLARLLREREYSKFYAAFAEMTGVDYVAARRAIKQESIDPLALICKSAGFDKALFVTLAVLRHAAGEDAFRDARELGQLYDAISADDAARAMRFWRMRKNMAA